MEGKLEPSKTGPLSKLSPRELLLLGFQLLSKNNINAPVRPRPPAASRSPSSPPQGPPLMVKDSPSVSPPSSPEQHQQVPQSGGRKRKRVESNEELSTEEKREKRWEVYTCKQFIIFVCVLKWQEDDE